MFRYLFTVSALIPRLSLLHHFMVSATLLLCFNILVSSYLLVETFIELTCHQGSTTELQRIEEMCHSPTCSSLKLMSICYAVKCVKSSKQSEMIHKKLLRHDVLNLVFKKTFYLQLSLLLFTKKAHV